MRAYDAAFYIAGFFILGIATASLGINIWLSLAIAVILISSILKQRSVLWYTIIFLSFFLGYFYLNFYSNINKEEIVFNENIVFEGVIIKEPKHGLRDQEVTLKLRKPSSGEIKIYTDIYPNIITAISWKLMEKLINLPLVIQISLAFHG